MILAIVNDFVVTQVITIDDSQYGDYAQNAQAAIQIDDLIPQPDVGWIFNGSTLSPGPNSVVSMKITKLALRERFTFNELIAMQTAAATSVTLQVLQDNLSVSTYIDLSRTDTIQGIEMLVQMGIITQDRATQILTTVPTATELYQG